MFHMSGMFYTIWTDPNGFSNIPRLRSREEIARIIVTWRMKLLRSQGSVMILGSTLLDEQETFLYIGAERRGKFRLWSEV